MTKKERQMTIFKKADDLISHLTKMTQSEGFVYRGYSKQNELIPSLIRDKNYQKKGRKIFKGVRTAWKSLYKC